MGVVLAGAIAQAFAQGLVSFLQLPLAGTTASAFIVTAWFSRRLPTL
jgi:hypothetical protein